MCFMCVSQVSRVEECSAVIGAGTRSLCLSGRAVGSGPAQVINKPAFLEEDVPKPDTQTQSTKALGLNPGSPAWTKLIQTHIQTEREAGRLTFTALELGHWPHVSFI